MTKRAFLLLLAALVLMTSCRHTTPFQSEWYFQALGEEGEYVMTADMVRVREGELGDLSADGGVLGRADRVTLSLEAGAEDSLVLSGALEGNYGKTTTNLGLLLSSDFKAQKENGRKSYTNGSLSVYSPKSGLVLFTEGDYASFEDRTCRNRVKLVDDETAELMANAVFSVYVKNPKALVDLGFEIPATVMAEIDKTLLLLSGRDGQVYLSGRVEAREAGSVRALQTLLRNQLVQSAKRKGENLDYKTAATYFVTDGNAVVIAEYPLSGEMLEKGRSIVSSSLGGLN